MEVDLSAFQGINYDTLEVDDFSGGITDSYVGGEINKYRYADNLLLEEYGAKAKLRLRPGSEVFDEDNPILDNLAERTSALKYFGGAILGFTINKVKAQNSAGVWTELVGPNGSHSVFSTSSDGDNIVSLASWQDHLLISNDNYEYVSKVYKNSANAYQIRTAGLPELTSSPSLSASTGSDSFLYRFCYAYTYLVGTVEYIDRGALTEVTLANKATISTTNPVVITNIPALSNTANGTLWDTTNIKVEIYRTTNGGVNFFKVAEVSNGTTSTSDTMLDATLQTQEPLYTEGDIVENDPTPLAGVVHVVDDTSIAYYARIKEGTEIRTNRLRQSVAGDIDACPADFTLDVGDEIVGVSSYLGRPILCCNNSVYRVDGAFDLFGRGGMAAQKISDRADCVSSQSIVQTMYGIFWCGSEYFYFTDGYKVIRINSAWKDRHKVFTTTDAQKKKIQGKYDRKNNRIWWTVQEDEASSDNDKCFVLDLNFGISENIPFTTISGGDEFRPTAIEFVDDTMYRGDVNSYLLIHREDLLTDPKIDTSISATSWAEKTIIYLYESCAFNMGTTKIRKAAPRIVVTCLNESNISLDITSINDNGRLTESLKPIRARSSLFWGDEDAEWGDPDLIWNFDGNIEEQRRFPRNSYRFSFKQIRLTNAFVVITNSDTNGKATTDTSAKTVTLSGSGNTFPRRSVGYYIALETDSYEREFLITAINSSNDSITVSDISNLLPSSGATTLGWVIRGYPKGEDFSLLSYAIDYTMLGKTQAFYRKGRTGELI